MTRISQPNYTPKPYEILRIGAALPVHDCLSQVTKDAANKLNAELADLPRNLYVQAPVDELVKCKTTAQLLAATMDPTIDNLHRHCELHRRRRVLLVEMAKQLELHRKELLEAKDQKQEELAAVGVQAIGVPNTPIITTPQISRLDSELNKANLSSGDCIDAMAGRQLEAAEQYVKEFALKFQRLAESPQ